MESGLITFFNVTHCGFYKHGTNEKVQVDGDLQSIIDEVSKWLKDRDFDQTIPWSIQDHPNRNKIYCKSVYTDPTTKDSVFVFWKKFGEGSGNVNGVLAKSKVGDTGKDTHQIKTNVGGQDVILGEPMYYWFIPEYDLIASVKFPNSVSESNNIFDYIKKCIDLRIQHPRKNTSERVIFNPHSKREIKTKNVTYKTEDGKNSLVFKFDATMKELSIHNTSLDKLSKEITHLVIRETITATKETQKNSIFTAFDKIRGHSNTYTTRKKQVEIVYEELLTADELSEIIRTYHDEFKPDSEWDNIGFKTSGVDSPTKWFDKYIDRKHLLMNEDDKKEKSYYPAETLLNALIHERTSLLDFMLKNDSQPTASNEN